MEDRVQRPRAGLEAFHDEAAVAHRIAGRDVPLVAQPYMAFVPKICRPGHRAIGDTGGLPAAESKLRPTSRLQGEGEIREYRRNLLVIG